MSRSDDWEKYNEADRWRAVARDFRDLERAQERIDGKLNQLLLTARGSLLSILAALVLLIIQRL